MSLIDTPVSLDEFLTEVEARFSAARDVYELINVSQEGRDRALRELEKVMEEIQSIDTRTVELLTPHLFSVGHIDGLDNLPTRLRDGEVVITDSMDERYTVAFIFRMSEVAAVVGAIRELGVTNDELTEMLTEALSRMNANMNRLSGPGRGD